MRKYSDENTWKTIQSYLPDYNRINDEIEPVEEYIQINRFNMHIDHYMQEFPKGIVVIFHGVGGNGRLVEYLAVPLWKAGYEVICPDLPLYGLTQYKGTVSYNDWVQCAIELCNQYMKEYLPFFTLGLSAGGLLAYQAGCEAKRIDGILATCLLDQREKEVTQRTASSKWMGTVGKSSLRFFHSLFGKIELPMKAVCNMKAIVNNEKLAETLMNDPISSGTWVSLEFLYTMLYPEIKIEPEDFNRCPVVLIHPGDDRWTAPELSRIFFDRLKCKKEYQLLPGGGHFTIEEKMLQLQQDYFIQFMNTASKTMNI